MDLKDRPFAADGLLASLALGCVLCLTLLGGRMIYSHRETYSFLAWNLVLALVPLVLSLLIDAGIRRKRRASSAVMGVVWLLFLPNAPYVITDFVHLTPDPPVPLWFDVLLFMAFAWTGLLLGLVSIHVLMLHVTRRLGAATTWLFVLIVLGASSMAIYLGRFDQWNSWDLLVRPLAVLEDVFSPSSLPRAFGVTAGFTLFLLVAYACVEALIAYGGSPASVSSSPRSAATPRFESPSPPDSPAAPESPQGRRRSRR